ncbi:Crp/Fnr family transcriptional regulator [Cytophagaceae bacterium DM2B3-1]|uniref:Crp/Fnr family transcriptional regulator n=1 Tax=Xanthocytophaga flava TaxID=3048013 RepID=A0ABT7CRH2_9BACT|nr:Crp/Fnr family transcriptional regulator [Xanthocytophaga flavus]MDJ1496286.1 Crp/Fnr family transcriptional regulator [Xanthocytophaga flavus]
MYNELILNNIAKHIHLEADEQAHFMSLLQPLKLKRKQIHLYRGEICKHSTFVLSGCMRGYTTDFNGFEHILNFAPPDWWIADMYSLISGQPGHITIDAIEETEVLLLSKADQEKLYIQIPQFERFFRIITEKSLVSYQERTLENLSMTAQDRYLRFCKRYPTLINHIPQKYIASYIGVTPEFLSKMRNDLLKQNK